VVIPSKNGKDVIIYTSARDGIVIKSGDTLDEFYDFMQESTKSN
jgi:hypothetical protein